MSPTRRSPVSAEALCLLLGWSIGAAMAYALAEPGLALGLVVGSAAGLAASALAWRSRERRRWARPAARLADHVMALALDPRGASPFRGGFPAAALPRAIEALAGRLRAHAAPAAVASSSSPPSPMTRSGLFEAPSGVYALEGVSTRSTGWTQTDMVNRLEPDRFRWIESSPGEQAFLGWSLPELRDKSFLDIVHEEDAARARGQFLNALNKGEVHGLVLRVRTARGKVRAVSIEVATRYSADHRVSHLRCHVTDVTAKLRADRELRQRTRQLIEVNARLVETNRQLEELKDRYRDLYQNAPAMYFSLDAEGRFLECNDTLLKTVGLDRQRLVGQSYEAILHPSQRDAFRDRFREFLQRGSIEVESRWVTADGTEIDVWVKGLALKAPDGRMIRSRSVAQDITTRKHLESELRVKHERLAEANAELLRRNKEMDEFLYVVSHDLQEPLRTIVSFSDFLLSDYGDRLDDEGKSFVRYIVDASRRLRALIQDLTTLSRAGKVTRDFHPVNLNEVLSVVRADLFDRIRSRGGLVEVEPSLPEVWGDRDRIVQLFTNLVTNGLKYNRREIPRVSIAAAPPGPGREAWVTIAVRDDGIGIDPKYHAKIFQLFRRLHAQDEYEGTGAGLAICQKIVQAHGGSIRVESAPDQGATFLVTLPAVPPAREPPPKALAESRNDR